MTKEITMMKRFTKVLALLVLLFAALPLQAQTILSTTTLASRLGDPSSSQPPGSNSSQVVYLASVTNVTPNTNGLFIPSTGEYMSVASKDANANTVVVTRGASGTRPMFAASGATVIITQSGSTGNIDPTGACTRGSGQWARYSPFINIVTGDVNVCIGSTWYATNSHNIVYNSLAPFTP